MTQVLLLTILLTLQLLDGYTTLVGLRSGRARESIPYLAWLMDRVGLVPALFLAKGAGAAICIWAALNAPVVGWILAALYLAVVINNFRVIR